MSNTHLASVLRLGSEKAIQLRFVSNSYELTLFKGRTPSKPAFHLSSGQLRQLLIELMPLKSGRLDVVYYDRYFVLQLNSKEWARVPDVLLMRLFSVASAGRGECLEV